MRRLITDFRDFAFSGNLVDLAIGVAIGAAFAGVVDSLVENLIMPLVAATRDRLVSAYRGQTVVCVSHVTPIKTLVRLALEADATALYRIHLDNASLSEVVWYDDGPAVVRLLNETAHLDGLERVAGA